MIRVDRVAKRFGWRFALRDVSFTVDRGEVVGFVGPNGAGKTTALRIITGFLDPDRGRVEVAGIDVRHERARACAELGYLPETVPLYDDMRVEEYLRFRARLKGVSRAELESSVDAAVAETELDDRRRQLIGRLSKGYRQRVGLADVLVARPPILVLDEPTAGLDPVQVRGVRVLLRRLARDHTILVSSHVLPEVGAIADRIVVLVEGRVVADGSLDELRSDLALPDDASLEAVFVELVEPREEGGEPEPTAGPGSGSGSGSGSREGDS